MALKPSFPKRLRKSPQSGKPYRAFLYLMLPSLNEISKKMIYNFILVRRLAGSCASRSHSKHAEFVDTSRQCSSIHIWQTFTIYTDANEPFQKLSSLHSAYLYEIGVQNPGLVQYASIYQGKFFSYISISRASAAVLYPVWGNSLHERDRSPGGTQEGVQAMVRGLKAWPVVRSKQLGCRSS